MEYYISNVGLINSIDKQIEELQRRKEALQMGYCYIPGLITIGEVHSIEYTSTYILQNKKENK